MQLEKRRVYIALGSNLASPLEQVNAAVKAIGKSLTAESWLSPHFTVRHH